MPKQIAALPLLLVALVVLAGCSGEQGPPPFHPAVRFHLDRAIGTSGAGPGQFSGPTTLTSDTTSNLFVVDSGNNRVQKLDATGAPKSSFGEFGSRSGEFENPFGIAGDGTYLYVTDRGNLRVEQFTYTGGFIAVIGSRWPEGGSLRDPTYLAVGGGVLAVADALQRSIMVYDSTGAFKQTIGSLGNQDGQFLHVTGLAIVGTTLYAADRDRNDIQAFNLTTGAFTGKIARGGANPGWLRAPTGIAAAALGLFVVDPGNDRVQLLAPNGAPQAIVRPAHTAAGALQDPSGVAAWGTGFAVADTGNDRLLTFLPNS